MALLGASLATDGEFMASDDECGAESAEACTLNALQLRRQQVQQEEGCHDIKEGEGGPCWEAIMWIKNVGLPKHANWYPDMTEDSPLGAFQFASWNTTHPKCPRPCNVPAPGSWCRNAAPPTLWRPAAAGPSINIKVQIHILTIWIFMFQDLFPQHFLCSPAPSGAMWLESIQVLSYNLFWWHLFKVEGGRGGSAGHLIRSTSEPPYDVMGFQECEDPEKVLGPAGLLQDLETGHGWVCL